MIPRRKTGRNAACTVQVTAGVTVACALRVIAGETQQVGSCTDQRREANDIDNDRWHRRLRLIYF
jgi:hypothetical protein